MSTATLRRAPLRIQRNNRCFTSSPTLSASITAIRTRPGRVLVDCGTNIACSSAGLDVASEAIPYIAGWGEHGALDAIHHYAETVDINARRIEDALHDQTDAAPEAAITARAVAPARITTRSAISPAWHRADDACIPGAASAWVAPLVTLALDDQHERRRPARTRLLPPGESGRPHVRARCSRGSS